MLFRSSRKRHSALFIPGFQTKRTERVAFRRLDVSVNPAWGPSVPRFVLGVLTDLSIMFVLLPIKYYEYANPAVYCTIPAALDCA